MKIWEATLKKLFKTSFSLFLRKHVAIHEVFYQCKKSYCGWEDGQ